MIEFFDEKQNVDSMKIWRVKFWIVVAQLIKSRDIFDALSISTANWRIRVKIYTRFWSYL